MRICRIYNNLSPNPEGFGIGLYELSLAQQKLGNDIYVINRTLSSKRIKNLKYNNISFNFIPFIPEFNVLNAFIPFGVLSFFRLNQLIKNKLIDLIHTHDIDTIYAIRRNKNVPLVTTFHVDKRVQMQRISGKGFSFFTKITENIGFQFNYLIWRKSNAIICISRQTMHRLINNYRVPSSKIYYIPNGVNIKIFNPTINSSDLKSSLKIDQNYPIILFVGQIYLLKGLKELIIAISKIKKSYPRVFLLIIGSIKDRRYFKTIKSLIKKNKLVENVKFLEKIPYSLMPRFYRAADIFILPSYSEGMPKVLLEAMASRLCVITTNLEGNKDLIKNNINGIYIEPKNTSDISNNLLKVLQDKKFKEKLALNAWKTAQEYDWFNIAQKIQEVYEIVLKR